jgi:hypothetical protein
MHGLHRPDEPLYDARGFRTIRPGSANPATEINLGNGRAIQMPGTGKAVEKVLREMKEGRDG